MPVRVTPAKQRAMTKKLDGDLAVRRTFGRTLGDAHLVCREVVDPCSHARLETLTRCIELPPRALGESAGSGRVEDLVRSP
jgi:hypothetical protein